MVYYDNYVAVMTSKEHAWKLDIMGEDPMDFLTRQPQSLLKFGDCMWIIQVAILNSATPVDLTEIKQNVWRPRSVPALSRSRSLLFLKTKKSRKSTPVWQLPKGEILGTDADVESALWRVVSERAGLTVRDIMGGFEMLVVLDSDPDEPVQLKLFFAVTVEELTPSGDTAKVMLLPGQGYSGHRWVRQQSDIASLLPVTPLHKPLIYHAWAFRPQMWQSPLEYLGQATSTLPYHDRYDYVVTAVISREVTGGPGSQLLLKRRKDDDGEEKWELPGGDLGHSDKTVGQVLRQHVRRETGLHVKTVLGQLRAQPWVISGWKKVGSRSVIILPYVVSVETGGVNLQDDATLRRVQTKEDISVLRITRCSLKLINAALGLASTSAFDVEQEAWKCEVM